MIIMNITKTDEQLKAERINTLCDLQRQLKNLKSWEEKLEERWEYSQGFSPEEVDRICFEWRDTIERARAQIMDDATEIYEWIKIGKRYQDVAKSLI